MILRPRDFRTTSAFAAVTRIGDVRGLEHAFTLAAVLAVGARRLLSTPSRRCRYPTGLVRCQLGQLGDMARVFADFDGVHPGRFPPGAQFNKSLVSTNSTTRAIRLPPIGRRVLLQEALRHSTRAVLCMLHASREVGLILRRAVGTEAD